MNYPIQSDLMIRNARLIDGSGAPAQIGGVAIRDDTILAVGDLNGVLAARELDAGGKALAPGFIDVHTHDDRALIADPTMAAKASQGVTTVVVGNCGISLAPLAPAGRPPPPLDLISPGPAGFFADFGQYLDHLDQEPAALNAVAQVGHSTLRAGAMDRLDRPATAREIGTMGDRLAAALEAGAIGMSTGLAYPPAAAATTAEVIALGQVLHQAGAIHTSHMRDEGDHVAESLAETFRIGAEARVPVVISHHKCQGEANFGRSGETLGLIDRARAGQRVAFDVYPYVASSTMLSADFAARSSRVLVTWSEAVPAAAGRDLDQIAAEFGLDRDGAIAALAPAGAIYFMMDEADVRRILAHPAAMIGSDGLPHDRHPHPRLWGTFPRVLGHYAREVGLMPLEQAVHKMTGLSAAQFGLTDRGLIRPGRKADLVLFDPETVIDRATFEAPTRPAAGIELVLVNGRPVWRDGQVTGDRPGRALRLGELGLMGG